MEDAPFASREYLPPGHIWERQGATPLCPSPVLTGTILFEDNNVANLELLSGVLEVEGYQVRCVSDGGLVGIWEHYSQT
jgi:hypothetical protein